MVFSGDDAIRYVGANLRRDELCVNVELLRERVVCNTCCIWMRLDMLVVRDITP